MNEENVAYLGLVRQIIKNCFQKPSIIYKNLSIHDIIGRLEFATSNNRLIEMYCDVVGIDSTNLRKKIVEKNIKYLYQLKYKKEFSIKLLETTTGIRWSIQ